MSAEKMVNRSLLRWAAAKFAGDAMYGFSRVVTAVGKTTEEMSNILLAFEADAAKRYENLTGRDLAALIGTPELYKQGVVPARVEVGDDDEFPEDEE